MELALNHLLLCTLQDDFAAKRAFLSITGR